MLVRWTEAAAADFTHICDYTEDHFGSARARQTALSIYDAADSLNTQSQRGRLGRRHGTRELSVPKLPFVLIYRVREGAIEINRILHESQQWP
jgi:toxin ParE1/3/4